MTWDLAAARARIGLPEDDTAQDTNLQAAMNVALAVAESYCDRRFMKQEDTQDFTPPIGPTLLVRRWPLDSLTSLQPLPPFADPEPDPVPVPTQWRMDKKRGMVFIVGAAPYIPVPAAAAGPMSTAPLSYPWGSAAGFTLTYTGGFDPLPADLEAALWMTFDQVWASTPGYGLPAGSQSGSGAVKSFGMDGMRIDYDTQGATGAGSKAEARGLMPASAIGILDFYRAETAALGG